jgi:adenine-specific DNA-methyltransferase
VLFVSIDDNEVAQLKLLLDNFVFSEKNFKTVVIWQKKVRPSNKNNDGFSSTTEYILMYSKKQGDLKLMPVELNPDYVKKVYKNPDKDPRGPAKYEN